MSHLFTQQRHFIGRTNFAAHIERLLHLYAAGINGSYFIIQVQPGEIGETAGYQFSRSGVGHENREITARNAETSIGSAVNPCSVGGKVREKIGFIAEGHQPRCFCLPVGSSHFLIVFQRHFAALFQA